MTLHQQIFIQVFVIRPS